MRSYQSGQGPRAPGLQREAGGAGLVSLKKRGPKGDLRAAHNYLKGRYRASEPNSCQQCQKVETRCDGHKLWLGRHRLDIRGKKKLVGR